MKKKEWWQPPWKFLPNECFMCGHKNPPPFGKCPGCERRDRAIRNLPERPTQFTVGGYEGVL